MNWTFFGGIIYWLLRRARLASDAQQMEMYSRNQKLREKETFPVKTNQETYDILNARFSEARRMQPGITEKMLYGKWLDVCAGKDTFHTFESDGTYAIGTNNKLRTSYFVYDKDSLNIVIDEKGAAKSYEVALFDTNILLLRSRGETKILALTKVSNV